MYVEYASKKLVDIWYVDIHFTLSEVRSFGAVFRPVFLDW